MKHAGQEDLDKLDHLLAEIRCHPELKEKKRGIFYRKSNAFLHFHADQDQLFADLRAGDDWQRFPVNIPAEHKALLDQIAIALNQP